MSSSPHHSQHPMMVQRMSSLASLTPVEHHHRVASDSKLSKHATMHTDDSGTSNKSSTCSLTIKCKTKAPNGCGGGDDASTLNPEGQAEMCANWEQVACARFGLFFCAARLFHAPGPNARRRFAKNLAFTLAALLVIGRAIAYLVAMNKATILSADWARTNIQFAFTLNALGALFWLRGTSLSTIATAIGQNASSGALSRGDKVFSLIIVVFYAATSAVWALQRTLRLDPAIDSAPVPSNGSTNGTYGTVAPNGMSPFVNCGAGLLDAVGVLLCGFVGALALVMFRLSFKTALIEWSAFKEKQMDAQIDKIEDPLVFRCLCAQMGSLLNMAHLIGAQLEEVSMGLFMSAILLNLGASFLANGGGKATSAVSASGLLATLDGVNMGQWTMLCLLQLVITLKVPYDVHSKIREVKEQLLLQNALWASDDEKLIASASALVRRLEGVRIHRIPNLLFQLALVSQMFLSFLLVAASSSYVSK